MKQVVEKALQEELSHHLEIDSTSGNANSRNGFMGKSLKGTFGEMPIVSPRDRIGAFELTLVRKGQTKFTAFDNQILSLCARGMSTRAIAQMFQEFTAQKSPIPSFPKLLKLCWKRFTHGNAAV